MRKKKGPPSLTEHLVRTVGFKRTVLVQTFVVQWAIFIEAHGRPPVKVEEFAAWWNESVATAYRYRTLFQIAFPEYTDPTVLWGRISAQVEPDDLRRDRSDVLAISIGSVTL